MKNPPGAPLEANSYVPVNFFPKVPRISSGSFSGSSSGDLLNVPLRFHLPHLDVAVEFIPNLIPEIPLGVLPASPPPMFRKFFNDFSSKSKFRVVSGLSIP